MTVVYPLWPPRKEDKFRSMSRITQIIEVEFTAMSLKNDISPSRGLIVHKLSHAAKYWGETIQEVSETSSPKLMSTRFMSIGYLLRQTFIAVVSTAEGFLVFVSTPTSLPSM